MKDTSSIAIILALLLVTGVHDYEEENKVLVLTDSTFSKAVSELKILMVEFYAPWCSHCKALAPDYEAAAELLSKHDPPIFLAKVDATAHTQTAGRYEIKGYPTLKLFKNGKVVDYEGGRSPAEISAYMKRKFGPEVTSLNSFKEVDDFAETAGTALIFLGEEKDQLDVFNSFAIERDDLRFGHCPTDECLEHYGLKSGNLMLLKPFDEKRNDYKEKVSEFSLKRFAKKFAIKKVISWEEKWSKHIFSNKNPGLFLMRESNDEGKFDDILEKVAIEYRGEIQVIDADVKNLGQLKDHLGIRDEDLPLAMIADPTGDLKKYKLDGEITKEALIKFCLDFRNKNKLKLFLKSEDVPHNQYGLIYELVGRSFPEVVFDQNKDVLVYFEGPETHCKTCKDVEPVIEDLAKRLKESPNLLIARIDGSKNEIENVRIKDYPQIKFWKATDKKRIVDFSEDKTKVEEYIKFLKKNSRHKIVETNKEEL